MELMINNYFNEILKPQMGKEKGHPLDDPLEEEKKN